MNWFHAVILGIVEGITEFLPISSSAHIAIVARLLGYKIDDTGMTAFTAVIQIGAIAAAVVYFWGDIVRILRAWVAGLFSIDARNNHDYSLGWGIVIGSIPVAILGLVFKDFIETTSRSLWIIAIALIAWSGVMWLADRQENLTRNMSDVTLLDSLIIGLFQAISPIFPGISRSGATISAGLFRKFDRVTATRLSFFMGIPALVAAGILEAVTSAKGITATVGWGPTLISTAVSAVVAYAAIAWLLKFVETNKFTSFIIYRVALGVILLVLLLTHVVS